MTLYIVISLIYLLILLSTIPFFTFSAKKSPNDIFGFRTKTASKNQQSWEFANLYYASLIKRSIFIYIIIEILVGIYLSLFTKVSDNDIEFCVIFIAACFLIITLITGIITQSKTKQFNNMNDK